jgi:hypothetical protein
MCQGTERIQLKVAILVNPKDHGCVPGSAFRLNPTCRYSARRPSVGFLAQAVLALVIFKLV